MQIEGLIAVLSLIVSSIIAIWGIYQTRVTSKLEAQVHRLSVDLDQTIQRLHRARDLANELSRAYFSLWSSSLMAQLNAEGRTVFSQELVAEFLIHSSTANVSRIELIALVGVIGDAELIQASVKYLALDTFLPMETPPQIMRKNVEELQKITTLVHSRIYKLLALTTADDPNLLWFTRPKTTNDNDGQK
jgi:hypothetical protein